MAEIVNLRMARKAKARGRAVEEAQAARARHGRTKGEKARDAAEADRLARMVEGARRDGAAADRQRPATDDHDL